MCIVNRPFCIEIDSILSQELRDQLFSVLNPKLLKLFNTLLPFFSNFKSSSKRPFGVLLRSAAKSGKKREKERNGLERFSFG